MRTIFIAAIALVVLAVSVVDVESACVCTSPYAGKYCGQRSSMQGDCQYDHIYQCDGQPGSDAHHYGPCRKGCRQYGWSRDYCQR